MCWQPLFSSNDKNIIWQKINAIAKFLTHKELISNPYLMHGTIGKLLFLFHYCFELTDEECYESTSNELFHTIEKILETAICINDSTHYNSDFDNGLSGIGWTLSYLVDKKMVDLDIFEILGKVDPWICRQMIYKTQNNKIGLLNGASGIALYCLKRDDRFHKEYICRFVLELYKQIQVNQRQTIFDYSLPWGLSGCYLLLRKIEMKYIDIKYLPETIKAFEKLISKQSIRLTSTLETSSGWHQNEVGLLWTLLHIEKTRIWALEQFMKYGKLHLNRKDQELESGLYGGSFSLGHIFNHIYQLSKENNFKDIAISFFYKGFKQANYTNQNSNQKLWYTGINGIYGLHSEDILGGLAGIGLAMLATVSNKKPSWDEMLLLSIEP